MFKVYDFEVFPNDWMCVILNLANNKIIRIHNDKAALLSSLSSKDILVGFNNYGYDDIILWAIQTEQDPYEISQQIIGNQFKRKVSCGFLTLDVKQELINKQLSLKEAMANMSMDIIETPVPFDQETLSEEEVQEVFTYCENDVRATAEIFNQREDYFSTKFEIVDTYKLHPSDVKETRAKLASKILKARKIQKPARDRLKLTYDKRIPLHELPKSVVEFYDTIEADYTRGGSILELEKMQLDYRLAGVTHTYGFGGLHASKENYIAEGEFLHIDARSYYPTLKINNNFISRAATMPERYKKMYDERLQLVDAGDAKAEIHKILLNATFGATKSEYNALYDPLQFNNTTVNGQLILTHLIVLLNPFIELVQSNSDGLIVKYEDSLARTMIDEVVERFAKHYELSFGVKEINKIVQRDANNYCVRYKNGEIVAKGFMKYFEGGNWERNSLSVVDTAILNYYMHGIDVQKTVISLFKKDLSAFQLVAKKGVFDGMVHEVFKDGQMQMEPIQNVNRIFATKDAKCGSVFKVRNDRYHKVNDCPEAAYIWNGSLDEMDRRKIDLNWYVKLIQKQLFV
ncbi:MAG: DNA polymerase B [Niallia sp.]